MKKLACVLLAFASAAVAIAETKTVTLTVKGWTCGSCAASTRIALKNTEGVEAVKTDLEKAETTVTYDDAKTTVEKIVQAIERLGYKATLKGASVSAASAAVDRKST